MKIDHSRLVSVDLVDITSLANEQLRQILEIRNQVGVRRNMYTDHIIEWEEHLKWVDNLRSSQIMKFFAVLSNGEIIGGVSISALDRKHRRADWAFYLSESTQGKGIGAGLEYQFVTKAFDEFGIEKLNCEVISFNERVVRLHQKFGFKIEGVRRDHVIRDGLKYDVVLLGITKQEWLAQTANEVSEC